MDPSTNDELRVRFIIDREMPDLYARLAGSKRPSREVVHLLRMGIQWEMALNGKLPMFASMANVGITSQQALALPVEVAPQKAEPRSGVMTVEEITAISGFTADDFSGPPPNYVG